VYRNFADVDEFSEVIREVQARPRRPRSAPPVPDEPENDLFGS
jgi:transcriptional repressor NrdR